MSQACAPHPPRRGFPRLTPLGDPRSQDAIFEQARGLAALHHGAHAGGMVRFARASILGLALAVLGGGAMARDYIVVASTDPAIARGASYDGGAKIALAPGATLTLMHASGDTIRLKGAAGGVTAPKRQAGQAEAERLAVLRVIVAPPERQARAALYATRTRAGICPEAASIKTLDAIVQVHQGGCSAEAAQALDAWVAAHPPKDA